jgi:hypothetical protein
MEEVHYSASLKIIEQSKTAYDFSSTCDFNQDSRTG